jgi:hypothetical protein
MQISPTIHKELKYRNGERGILLTTERESKFSVMTIRDKDDSILHHTEDGKYLGLDEEHQYDIIKICE